jgi:DNA-binding MarR family transcriptional regulator
MALKRIYTFDEGKGLSLQRVTPTEAVPHDEALAPVGLTNWQLASLYVIELEESATDTEIGFALVMDRPTVAAILRPLEHRKAIRKLPSRGGRRGAVALTDDGRDLLGQGLQIWRATHSPRADQAIVTRATAPQTSDNISENLVKIG